MKTDSIPNLLKKMLNTIGAVVCPRREKALKKEIHYYNSFGRLICKEIYDACTSLKSYGIASLSHSFSRKFYPSRKNSIDNRMYLV
jgi:hypothetical protein